MSNIKIKINTRQISWWRTDFGDEDIKSVSQAIQSGHVSQGPVTAAFEQEVAQALDVPYVVATSSGSTAILMALMALGIGSGDEVIVPNRTWIATAHAPAMLGATVKVVDVLPNKPLIDISQIRSQITYKTKAIISVPLNGRAVEMDEIWKLAKEFNLAVVEDSAQAFFAKHDGQYMGTQSDAGCFSLSIAKLIPAGQGGFVVTKRKDIYESLKRIRMHGVDDVINCNFHQMGFNFRLTDLQAAIARVQLSYAQERIEKVKQVYAAYEAELNQFSFLKLVPADVTSGELPIYIEVLCDDREKLVSFLAQEGIQARPIYPNLETAKYLNIEGEFPNAKVFSDHCLVLPCGPGQSLENIDYVISVLKQFEKSL